MSEVKKEVSDLDKKYFKMLRDDVTNFVRRAGGQYDREGLMVLDVAPQDHEGAKPHFPKATIETLDISPGSGATYVADLCQNNKGVIPDNHFDVVVCTEVLEHTLNPFAAVDEIKRVLREDGLALISTPYNFRIHGPLPDCWRFTEHGLRALFKDFEIVTLDALEEEDRFLMPIHYTLIARKAKHEQAA